VNNTPALTAMPTATRSPGTARQRIQLHPQPPFRLDLTAWALRRRGQNAIDFWDGRTYRRALVIERRPAEVAVTQAGGGDAPRLDVTITGRRLTPSAGSIATAALTRLLGLEIDLADFYARAARDRTLGPLAKRYRGLKPPRFPTLFECLLNAVACQQLSLAAGLTVLSRLAAAAGPPAGTLRPFPAPGDVLRLSAPALRELGFSERKAHTILELARAAADGEFDLDRFEPLDDEDVVQALVRWPGIGRWSADYVLLRGLGRLHVFPPTDVGAINGLRWFLAASGLDEDPARALERWRRDAGILYFHLLLRGLEERGTLDGGMR
jgi:DNA-3-methyladenine glycosylase II